MTHHPSWNEVRNNYLADSEVRAAYDVWKYEPVVRDRNTERALAESIIPGYKEAREALERERS